MLYLSDRCQKNVGYLLMIQCQILKSVKCAVEIWKAIKISESSAIKFQYLFGTILISNDPLCNPTTYSFQKKELKLQCGTSRGGEAEPSIFSWLKGTFQFDWKIFLYFGGEKYDAFGKLGNLNIIPIVCCYNFSAMLYTNNYF